MLFVVCCLFFLDCCLLVDVFWLLVVGCSWLVVVCRVVVRRFVDRRFAVRRLPFAICRRLLFVVLFSLDCRLLVDVFWLLVVGCSWLVVVCRFVVRRFVDRRFAVRRSPFAICRRLLFVVLLFVVCGNRNATTSRTNNNALDHALNLIERTTRIAAILFLFSEATKRYRRLIPGFCTYAVETGTLQRPEPIITHLTMG